MLKDHKFLIYGGGLFAGAAIAASVVLPSEEAFCLDNCVLCAPVSPPIADSPSNDEPQPIARVTTLSVAGSTATVQLSGRSMAMSKARGNIGMGTYTLTLTPTTSV